jgi:hypothetical protein
MCSCLTLCYMQLTRADDGVDVSQPPLIARPRRSCKIHADSKLVDLMWRSAVVGTYLAVSAGMLVSGCAATCGANPQKLASLQRGMTYAETSRVMGCPGQLVSEYSPLSGDFATWNGTGPVRYSSTAPRSTSSVASSCPTRRRIAALCSWILYRPPKAMPMRAMMARLACGSIVP